jgi:dTDP-glucose 4,6-dehydratase
MESRSIAPARIIVTGGAGFIGSHLVRSLVLKGHDVLVFDKLSYAGHRDSLDDIANSPNLRNKLQWCIADVCDGEAIRSALQTFAADAIFHLAAESHVDRSIDAAMVFAQSNTIGTVCLLEASLRYWSGLDTRQRASFRIIHVSTDEVFGSLGPNGLFDEQSRYDPSSPYSASKAAADHFARSFRRTYGLPIQIVNSSNNYGPFQHPEKLIPVTIQRALAGEPIAVYGQGNNVRDWLYVLDHCQALIDVWSHGEANEDFLVGAKNARSNMEVVHTICDRLDATRPKHDGSSYRTQIQSVKDRPGHDFRYAVDPGKIMNGLKWKPMTSWDDGIRATVAWYIANPNWPDVPFKLQVDQQVPTRRP